MNKRLIILASLLTFLMLITTVSAAPMAIYIKDHDGNNLNGVTISIYTSVGMPPQVGSLYAKMTINSGDYWTVPDGEYLVKLEKTGYIQRWPTEDNRVPFGAVSVTYYMDPEPIGPTTGYPVTLKAVNPQSQTLDSMSYRIYSVNPVTGRIVTLIRTVNAPSGSITVSDLQAGTYAVEAVKSGWSMVYPIEQTKFLNTQGSSTVVIPMESAYPTWTVRAVDNENSLVPGVEFKIYHCDPYSYTQGQLVKTQYSQTGELLVENLPRSTYCFEALRDGYTMRYPPSQNRYSTMYDSGGTSTCILDPADSYKVILNPYDFTTNSPISGATVKCYSMLSNTVIDEYVETWYDVSYGDTKTGLTPGRYCFMAYKDDYVQLHGMFDIRAVLEGQSKTASVSIPMHPYTMPACLESENLETQIYETFTDNFYEQFFDGYAEPGKSSVSVDTIQNHYVSLELSSGVKTLRKAGYACNQPLDYNMYVRYIVDTQDVDLPIYCSLYNGTFNPTPDSEGQKAIWVSIKKDEQIAYVYISIGPNIVYRYAEPLDGNGPYAVEIARIEELIYTRIASARAPKPYVRHTYTGDLGLLSLGVSTELFSTEPKTAILSLIQGSSFADCAPVGHNLEIGVIDQNTADYIRGSTVKIYSYRDGAVGSVIREVNTPTGYITLTDLPPDIYALEAFADNYYAVSSPAQNVVDTGASAVVHNLTMRSTITGENTNEVIFRPYDLHGYQPLTGVRVNLYFNEPNALRPGELLQTYVVTYDQSIAVPKGMYFFEAILEGYEQAYQIEDSTFSNEAGETTVLIPMRGKDIGLLGSIVRVIDRSTKEPIDNVKVTIYQARPDYSLGSKVYEGTLDSEESIILPDGEYCASASKKGYRQSNDVSNTRLIVRTGEPSVLIIPMDKVGDGIGYYPDDDTSFLDQSIRAIANLFGVSESIGKTIFGLLLCLGIGMTVAKNLNGGAAEFGFGLLGGAMLSVVIGLLPPWIFVVLMLVIGLWIGKTYMSGGQNG